MTCHRAAKSRRPAVSVELTGFQRCALSSQLSTLSFSWQRSHPSAVHALDAFTPKRRSRKLPTPSVRNPCRRYRVYRVYRVYRQPPLGTIGVRGYVETAFGVFSKSVRGQPVSAHDQHAHRAFVRVNRAAHAWWRLPLPLVHAQVQPVDAGHERERDRPDVSPLA